MSSVEERLKAIRERERQTPDGRGYARAVTLIVSWLRAGRPNHTSEDAHDRDRMIADEIEELFGEKESE